MFKVTESTRNLLEFFFMNLDNTYLYLYGILK